METWSPQTIYACAFASAASIAIAAYIRADKPITFWKLLAEGVFHGLIGAGLGALCHEWKWKNKPGTIIAVAIFYGGGLLSLAEIKGMVIRMLNVSPPGNTNEPKQ